MSTGNFPKLWASGYIVPIYKSGSKDDPLNYRGITIGCSVGKLFTKILNSRLEKFFFNRKIIKWEQIGFCKTKRTSDHLFVLKTLIDKYTQQGNKQLYTCIVDFKKAFDMVGHNELFFKMRLNGISDHFYNILKDMYAKTELCVKLDSIHATNFFPSNVGVRQGDNLSPNLFKLFINDLPEQFDNSCYPVKLNNLKLNCLMYADDVILISENAQGLQNALNKLQLYCEYWGLDVNVKKTKSLVFINTGKLTTHKFTFKGNIIEQVRKYTYLGITFSVNGSFTNAAIDVYNKGLKAYFKFRKCFEGNKPKIKTLIHVFDHTVKPVLLYGSEIWGLFSGKKLLAKTDSFFDKLCKNLKIENIHRQFCKYVLEVPKRASNSAVMGELGRYPLYIDVVINMINYFIRLHNCKDNEELLPNALSLSKELFENGKHSWYSSIDALLSYLDINIKTLFQPKLNIKKFIFNKLKIKYEFIWHQELFRDNPTEGKGNKLRTYRLFKNIFKFENYLIIGNYDQRKSLTKFRISAHDLEIERGRYTGIQQQNRICKICQNNVEDECHFLLKCEPLENERKEILEIISNKYKNFSSLNIDNKFVWLLSSEDKFVITNLYKLIKNLNNKKEAVLSENN